MVCVACYPFGTESTARPLVCLHCCRQDIVARLHAMISLYLGRAVPISISGALRPLQDCALTLLPDAVRARCCAASAYIGC